MPSAPKHAQSALVIEYLLSQSRNKTISGIRMKNSIFESHVRKMFVTWVTLMLMYKKLRESDLHHFTYYLGKRTCVMIEMMIMEKKETTDARMHFMPYNITYLASLF